MFGYKYIIGDPVLREKIRSTLRVIGMSIVLGMACLGFGVLLSVYLQIAAW